MEHSSIIEQENAIKQENANEVESVSNQKFGFNGKLSRSVDSLTINHVLHVARCSFDNPVCNETTNDLKITRLNVDVQQLPHETKCAFWNWEQPRGRPLLSTH